AHVSACHCRSSKRNLPPAPACSAGRSATSRGSGKPSCSLAFQVLVNSASDVFSDRKPGLFGQGLERRNNRLGQEYMCAFHAHIIPVFSYSSAACRLRSFPPRPERRGLSEHQMKSSPCRTRPPHCSAWRRTSTLERSLCVSHDILRKAPHGILIGGVSYRTGMQGPFYFDQTLHALWHAGGRSKEFVAHGVRNNPVGCAMQNEQGPGDGRQLAI